MHNGNIRQQEATFDMEVKISARKKSGNEIACIFKQKPDSNIRNKCPKTKT